MSSTMKAKKTNRVLSVYPNQWGVAFAIFDEPDLLVDYGVAYVQPADNNKALQRVEKLIVLHAPDVIVTRAVTKDQTTVSLRVRKLVDMIADLVKEEKLELRQVSRSEVQEHFSNEGECSKYDISQMLIQRYPALAPCGFPVRKRWKAEHHYVGIFDAVAMINILYG
ncbi:MAG: hypothetical protein RLP14_08125 [Owenweeksia sp.]